MVTPAYYHTSQDLGRRYSRGCPPYPFNSHSHCAPDRRFQLSSHHESRTPTMTEREDDSSQPRKRIAVACGRCRKRKIRCSGDPGHGNPCSNCKNAGHEPCLFLRVSSTETPLREGGNSSFGYDMETARAYQSRGTVSPLNSVSQYATDMPAAGDVLTYRQSAYPYGNKGYYTPVAGWGGGYADDGVTEYALNYPSYPHMSQEPVQMVPGYRYGSGSKSAVYVDADNQSYPYPSLVHRPAPAVSSDLPNFSLSGMAASLPSSERLPNVNRTLTSSSAYRSDGLPGPSYASSKTSSSAHTGDGYSSMNSSFESPVSYGPTTTLPSSRSAGQSEAAYHSSSSSTTDVYAAPDYRGSQHDSDSCIYDRRGSQHSSEPSLPNGHVYVPEAHHAHPHASASSAESYASTAEAPTTVCSRTAPESHRKSAGSVRGA